MSIFQIGHVNPGTPGEHFKIKGYSIEKGVFGLVEKIITADDVRRMAIQVLAKFPLTDDFLKLIRYEKQKLGAIEEQVEQLVKLVKWDLRSEYTSKDEDIFAYHSRICIYLLIKYHFQLLSPVYGFGKMWNLKMEGVDSKQPSPSGQMIPDDILYHIGQQIEDPRNFSILSMSKRAMNERLSTDYYKYVNILPGQVFHRAHLEYQSSTDPVQKEKFFTLMKTAIEYGAISSIIVHKTNYLYTIWKDIDTRVADLLMVEIFNFHTMKVYYSSDVQTIRTYGLPMTTFEVINAMQYYGRMDLLLKYVFSFQPKYHLPSRPMYGLEGVPDLQMLETFAETAKQNRDVLLLRNIETKTIDMLYHARLIVDAVKKGLINTITTSQFESDDVKLCRGMRELSTEDKALIFPLFTDKTLARFILYGDNPREVKVYFTTSPKLLVRHGYIPTEDDIASLGNLEKTFKYMRVASKKYFKKKFRYIKVADTRVLIYIDREITPFIKVGGYYYQDSLHTADHFLALKRLLDKGEEIEAGDVHGQNFLYDFHFYDPLYPDMTVYKSINEKALTALLIRNGKPDGGNIYDSGETVYSQMDFLTPMVPQQMVDGIIKDYFSRGNFHFFF